MRKGRTLLLLLLATAAGPSLAAGVELPARFEGNRIVLLPQTTEGTTLEFRTDSGGGFNAISASMASRLLSRPVEPEETIAFPDFDPAAAIPANPLFKQGRLVVVADEELAPHDGFLGGRWFGNRIWELDYLHHRIVLHDRYEPPPEAAAHAVALGFQTNASGARTLHWPSVPIEVDGREILVLFDTGATATLTASSSSVIGLPAGTGMGASFITATLFAEWQRGHPDWLVVPGADLVHGYELDMIRAEEVTIAGHTVGPVWFAARADADFTDFISSGTDRTVYGAIGGSAFQYFRIVIDYPGATAWFFRD